MRTRILITLVVALSMLLGGAATAPFAAEEGTAEKPVASTTEDSQIPVEELQLMLKAFTKDELLVEADGWQALLRAKVVEIGTAEVAVMRQNQEIEKAEEIQEQTQKAKEQLQELDEKVAEAQATGDGKKIEETEQAAAEAQETIDEIRATVDEAAEAAQRTAEVQQEMDPKAQEGLEETTDAAGEAQEALGRVQEAAQGMGPGSRESVRAAAEKAQVATQDAQQAAAVVEENVGKALERAEADAAKASTMEKTATAMEKAEEEKKEQKVDLLETVNQLREERTLLIDNLEAVLDELETKTDKEDTDTLATIKDYRLYISSVQGIRVDVKDTTSTWIAIKGWLLSDEGGLRWAGNIGLFFGILIAAWIVSRILSGGLHRALKMTGGVSLLLENFLVGAVRWVVMAVGIIMALASLEVSIGPLLAVVGAAGFVIAFALQDSLSNFASGLMILFFRPFDVGDVVDAGGVSGKVIAMNLVSTSIKTFDNKDMVVPNNKIWQDVITNATGVDTRRVDMEFGIGYDDDIDKAQGILEEIVAAHPKALKDPEPTIRMNTLADSSVNFICRPWAKTADYWDVYWDVTKAVKQRFDSEEIGIPFPQRDVHLYIEEGSGKQSLAGLTKGQVASGGPNPQPYELNDNKEGGSEG